MKSSLPLKAPTVRSQIVTAAQANLVPGLLLQTVALLLVLCFYFWPAAHTFFESVAHFKARIGIWYAIFAMAFFAGVLPILLQRLQSRGRHEKLSLLPFHALLWAFIGVAIDLFYNLQASLFGQGTDIGTIIVKVAVDVFVFTPFVSVPLAIIALAWKENGFGFQRTRSTIGRGWYRERVWPTVVAAWIVWIPAVALVYALPLALQFPIHNIIECMWVLILTFINQQGNSD